MKPAIDAQDEDTWPPDLLKRFDEGLPTLCAFEEERRRVDRLAERNVVLRCNPPRNPHADARRSAIEAANGLLRGRDLLAFHCTNLHPAEIGGVRKDGLFPLAAKMAERRVRARVAAGDIPEPIGARLLAESMAAEEYRSGLLWLIFTRTTLQDWSGMYRLLGFWGGEALYASHEHDPTVADILSRIGRPAIIELAAPVSYIDCGISVGERLLIGFLSRRGVDTGHEPEFEGHATRRIVGNRIRRMIGPDDPDFVHLTGRIPNAKEMPIIEPRKSNWKLIS